MSERTKQNSTTILVHEDGEFKFKKFTSFFEFDKILRKWVKSDEKISYESLEEHGLTKSPIKLKAIFIKEYESRETMSGKEILFFLSEFTFRIPDLPQFKHAYMKFDPETCSVIINLLDKGMAWELDFNDSKFVTMTEPNPITRKRAKELMDERKTKSVYPSFLVKRESAIFTVARYQIS